MCVYLKRHWFRCSSQSPTQSGDYAIGKYGAAQVNTDALVVTVMILVTVG